jgi:surface antigen
MSKTAFAALAAGAIVLGACAGDPYYGTGPRENTGTLLGAVGGALIGSQFGGGTGERVAAAVAGAAIGGLIGNRIGAALDEEDRRRAYAAQIEALEEDDDDPVEWRNPRSGRYGRIEPGRVYYSRGVRCRPFTHTIYINGRPEVARGTACRNRDGTWTPLA